MSPGVLSGLLFIALLPQTDRGLKGQLQGRVMDVSGSAISASIRVIDPGTEAVVLQFGAEEDGTFKTSPLPPGVYSLTALETGFRRRELRVVVESGHNTDVFLGVTRRVRTAPISERS